MTFVRAIPHSDFHRQNFSSVHRSDTKFVYLTKSTTSQVSRAYSRLVEDSFTNYKSLNSGLSGNAFLVKSPTLPEFADRDWKSRHLIDVSGDNNRSADVKLDAYNDLKTRILKPSTRKTNVGRPVPLLKDQSLRLQSDYCGRVTSSTQKETERRPSQGKQPLAHLTTCSREISLQMPVSTGQSSRSSAFKKSDRKDSNRSLHTEHSLCEEFTSSKKTRAHSADARPRETTSCSFFYFIRRRKKSKSRSTSPEIEETQYRHNTRDRFSISCASGQSKQRSERSPSPSYKERKISVQSHASSSRPLTPAASNPPPSVTSPTTPLLGSASPPSTKKRPHYTSRSRPKHRRDKRQHRSSKRAAKPHPDDQLRHEDLPPHPSLLKTTVVKFTIDLDTPCSKPSDDNTNNIINSNNSNSKDHPRNIDNSISETNCRSRKNSKQESSINISAAVSSASGHLRRDSKENSSQNLREKSLRSSSKADLEEEENCQFTTSSSDQLSRESFRSQSLPSFRGGDHFEANTDTRVVSDAEDFEYIPTDMRGPLNLSLCGCGFLGMYHLGVVSCLALRAPSFLERLQKVGGASAGALMAAVLVTARDKIEESVDHVQNLAKEIRKKPLGALTPGYSFTRSLRYMLEDILPEDAHETAQGKLYVSLTNAETKKNELLCDFQSRDELIEALVASCYIPVYAGIKPPTIRGKKYIDGGLSDNLPRFETGRTITVSPFDGKSDIGPKQGQELAKKAHFISVHNQDIQVSMNNVKKGAHAFFPPKRQILQEYFERGRYDASRFLIREGLYEITHQPSPKAVLYESSV